MSTTTPNKRKKVRRRASQRVKPKQKRNQKKNVKAGLNMSSNSGRSPLLRNFNMFKENIMKECTLSDISDNTLINSYCTPRQPVVVNKSNAAGMLTRSNFTADRKITMVDNSSQGPRKIPSINITLEDMMTIRKKYLDNLEHRKTHLIEQLNKEETNKTNTTQSSNTFYSSPLSNLSGFRQSRSTCKRAIENANRVIEFHHPGEVVMDSYNANEYCGEPLSNLNVFRQSQSTFKRAKENANRGIEFHRSGEVVMDSFNANECCGKPDDEVMVVEPSEVRDNCLEVSGNQLQANSNSVGEPVASNNVNAIQDVEKDFQILEDPQIINLDDSCICIDDTGSENVQAVNDSDVIFVSQKRKSQLNILLPRKRRKNPPNFDVIVIDDDEDCISNKTPNKSQTTASPKLSPVQYYGRRITRSMRRSILNASASRAPKQITSTPKNQRRSSGRLLNHTLNNNNFAKNSPVLTHTSTCAVKPNLATIQEEQPKSSAQSIAESSNKSNSDVRVVNEGNMRNLFGNVYNAGQISKNGLRLIVIDGSNVALGHSNGRFFSVRGLKICIDYFLRRGHRVKAFVPQYRAKFTQSSDQKLLNRLQDQGHVVFTPSRDINGRRIVSYDDRFIVQCAAMYEGIIVSNDNYRDLMIENPNLRPTIEQRLLMCTWVDDMILFPRDPLGRHGPTLDRFLRFP